MSYLIFCSAEIGGLPYLIADVLNRNGIETYYISLSGRKTGHDTKTYHFGTKTPDWDLSDSFRYQSPLPHRIDNIIYSKYLACRTLKKLKKKYNFTHCFATGIKSFLLKEASIEYHYWSYGSDLDKFCFHLALPATTNPFFKICYNILFTLRIQPNARRSILLSDKSMIAPYQKHYLDRIQNDKPLFFLPHIISTRSLDKTLLQKKKAQAKLQRRYKSDLLFFSSTRHEWHGDLKTFDDNKGNDIMLKSFALFLEDTGRRSAKLILINKGSDVCHSKRLAGDLHIENNLIWLEQMPRPMLQEYYLGATVAFGQFHTPVLTYASLEPLAAATPTVSYFGSQSEGVPFYPTAPPLLNTKVPDAIATKISRLTKKTIQFQKDQNQSFQWIQENCSEKNFCETFTAVFKNT